MDADSETYSRHRSGPCENERGIVPVASVTPANKLDLLGIPERCIEERQNSRCASRQDESDALLNTTVAKGDWCETPNLSRTRSAFGDRRRRLLLAVPFFCAVFATVFYVFANVFYVCTASSCAGAKREAGHFGRHTHRSSSNLFETGSHSEHCWVPCGGKPGFCAWCGRGRACCRFGADHENVTECKTVVNWSTHHWHTCVDVTNDESLAVLNDGSTRVPGDSKLPLLAAGSTRGPTHPGARNVSWQARDLMDQDERAGYSDLLGSIHDADLDIAQCTIDVAQAVYSLGEAGTAISAAAKVCDEQWVEPWQDMYGKTGWIEQSQTVNSGPATCAAAAASVMSSLVFSGAFLADAAANCALGYDIKAQCTTDVSWLVGSLSGLASAGAGITQTCEHEKGADVSAIAFDGDGRRLRNHPISAGPVEWLGKFAFPKTGHRVSERKTRESDVVRLRVAGVPIRIPKIPHKRLRKSSTETTQCVFDISQSSMFFARAAEYTERARRDCGTAWDISCAVDLEFLLDSVEFVGSYIAYATTHCGKTLNLDALCVASALKTVASIEGVASASTDFLRSCQAISGSPEKVVPEPPSRTPLPQPVAPLVPATFPHSDSSEAPIYTLWMYRATNSETFGLGNSNTGNLAGVIWYLAHEVVVTEPPKYGISRILRYKVQVKAPKRLHAAGMNFGVRYAYDHGLCTGPGECGRRYNEYGYFVGCNKLGDFPYPKYDAHYPGSVWYSLPLNGLCSGVPTGADTCTYSYQSAGEITLDELQGSSGRDFWKWSGDVVRNQQRVRMAHDLFKEKYPLEFGDLENPRCDFNYDSFYGDSAEFK